MIDNSAVLNGKDIDSNFHYNYCITSAPVSGGPITKNKQAVLLRRLMFASDSFQKRERELCGLAYCKCGLFYMRLFDEFYTKKDKWGETIFLLEGNFIMFKI